MRINKGGIKKGAEGENEIMEEGAKGEVEGQEEWRG